MLDAYVADKKDKASQNLSDQQLTLYNNALNKFENNAQVKTFRESIATYKNFRDAVARAREDRKDGKTGIPDVSIVYMFMKQLDPTSVVRE